MSPAPSLTSVFVWASRLLAVHTRLNLNRPLAVALET